jgi:hypothetical protein
MWSTSRDRNRNRQFESARISIEAVDDIDELSGRVRLVVWFAQKKAHDDR